MSDTEAELRRELEIASAKLERIRQIMDLSPDAFYAIDRDGIVLLSNAAATRFLSGGDESIEGQHFVEVARETEAAREILDQLVKTMDSGEPIQIFDRPLRHSDGTDHVYDYREIPFVIEQTGTRAIVGTATDVTRRAEYERTRREHERVERDLEIARAIQRALLPSETPEIAGFEIAGWSEAADHTGGDHYDWLPLGDGRVVVSLADVSGHGIGPAIVASVCRAYARATLDSDRPLSSVVTRLNEFLYQDLPADRFITFVAAVLEPDTGVAHLLSAGHGPILLYEAATDSVRQLPAHGAPLAVMPGVEFEAAEPITMRPGDVLVLITDGFFEWPNGAGEQVGIGRLEEAIRASAAGHPSGVIAASREAVRAHVGDVPQPDDMTAVVVKRTG